MVGLVIFVLRVFEVVGLELFWFVGMKGLGVVDVEIGCIIVVFIENWKGKEMLRGKLLWWKCKILYLDLWVE